jgi:hypothetical protein
MARKRLLHTVSPRLVSRMERLRTPFLIAPWVGLILYVVTWSLLGPSAPADIAGKCAAGGSAPELVYADSPFGSLRRVSGDITVFRESWLGVHTATRARVRLVDEPYTPMFIGQDRTVTQQQMVEDMRDAFRRRCVAIGDPSAADLFNATLATTGTQLCLIPGMKATGGETRRIYTWRYPLAAASMLSMLVFMAGLPAAVVYAVLVRSLRRNLPQDRCANCGYTRQGLAQSSPCPECGTGPQSAQPPAP